MAAGVPDACFFGSPAQCFGVIHQGKASRRSQRRVVRFPGADADHAPDVGDEDLAVAYFAGLRSLDDRLDDLIQKIASDGNLDARLGHEINDVLRAAIKLRVAALPAKPFTSVTVMPETPMSDSAARTSSSLKGLMIAVTSFMNRLSVGTSKMTHNAGRPAAAFCSFHATPHAVAKSRRWPPRWPRVRRHTAPF